MTTYTAENAMNNKAGTGKSISPECAAKEVRKAADMAKITDEDRAEYDAIEAKEKQLSVL